MLNGGEDNNDVRAYGCVIVVLQVGNWISPLSLKALGDIDLFFVSLQVE